MGTDVEPPEVAVGNADLITCANDTIFLQPEQPATADGVDFEWFGPDGESIPEANFDLAVTEAGNYTLVVTNTDNGCTASETLSVEADIDPPQAAIATPQALNCDRTVVTLDGSDSDLGSGLVYEWSTGGGQLEGPVNELMVEATAAGWYVLAVTNTQNGCTGLDSVEVLQTAEVITDAFWSAVPPACPGDSDGEIVLDTVLGGTAPFFFALGESPFAADAVFEGLSPGLYPVAIEDANGCTWAGEVILPEAEGISVSLGPERAIRLGEQDTLVPLIEPAAYDSIWWWPADGKPEGAAYVVAPTQTTVYQVWVQNERGCVDTSLVRIKVIDDLPVYVPNVFSPNGDGQNDVFMVFAAASIQEVATFQVYDRWGDMVYEAENFSPNDPAYGWDGELRGYEMDSAVFAYVIEVVLADGRREVVAGEVLLLR
ncbi:MAG: T9SS type B sorting domain-containing protein [Bacteroidetes bacterium]|nr:T9SS type B sorting domain-containing protein [Bacteroidota bacterium]